MRPRLLDLFCGAGGAGAGYARAGWDVVGVDIAPQPRYPFEFHQADATTYPLDGFDAVHASPPCQGYSRMRHLPWLADKVYPLLLEPMWQRLEESGLPWILENVADAPMPSSTVLCGATFGLPFYRHRRFGSSHLLLGPAHVPHRAVIAPGGASLADRYRGGTSVALIPQPVGHGAVRRHPAQLGREVVPAHVPLAVQAAAMGCEWMTRAELTEAIPPAYTEYLGRQLLEAVLGEAVGGGGG